MRRMGGRGEGEERDWAFWDDKAESVKTCEGQDKTRKKLEWPEVGLEPCWGGWRGKS